MQRLWCNLSCFMCLKKACKCTWFRSAASVPTPRIKCMSVWRESMRATSVTYLHFTFLYINMHAYRSLKICTKALIKRRRQSNMSKYLLFVEHIIQNVIFIIWIWNDQYQNEILVIAHSPTCNRCLAEMMMTVDFVNRRQIVHVHIPMHLRI